MSADSSSPTSPTPMEALRGLVDRMTRRWARDSFDETILTPLDAIEPFRAEVGLPPFTADEIKEFNNG